MKEQRTTETEVPYWDDVPGALRELAPHAPPGLAPLMLQAAREIDELVRMLDVAISEQQ